VKPGEDIKMEIHPNVDQFIRIEKGFGKLIIGNDKSQQHSFPLSDGVGFIIPSGTWHQVINDGSSDLKLYTIYTPPEHPIGQIQIDRPNDDEKKQSGGCGCGSNYSSQSGG